MTSKTNDVSSQILPQGDNGALTGQPGSLEHQSSRSRNQVLKSGPLFISSKGIGWTSWKKRWFILTRTSLVFFRTDPSAATQKGGEMNLTLGGIDLNNSASVEVKVDKKLLTVFFPDGRDGRAFTLKAETLEDLHEWKTALENALKLAPSANHGAGQNGLLKNEPTDTGKDKPPVKSVVIGRPILLALEDIDGSPSFLEKALRFIEDHGVKVEGILRQAADVDDVHRRVREYEHGKIEFSSEEDAHVIADCIKYILRELPSSPVPASCCKALLEAYRTDRNSRLNAMRTAILETFPEPNRRLLHRILSMMQIVVSNKAVNRMSTSAVAACMSPLLLRPLLAGDCELENTHMDVAGDGCFQLLQAAAAANHAQAIIITLLDEYDNIFGEGSETAELFSDSDESGTETDEASDDDIYDDDNDNDEYVEDDEHEYASDDHEEETDDEYEHSGTESCSESGDHTEGDSSDEKHSGSSSLSASPKRVNNKAKQRSPSVSTLSLRARNDDRREFDENMKRNNDRSVAKVDDTRDIAESRRHTNTDSSSANESVSFSPKLGAQMSLTKFQGTSQLGNRMWGRTSARKNLSMESIDFSLEDEDDEIQRLEAIKSELQTRIAEEANGNAVLQASLEKRRKALQERRLALQKDVTRLQEQLQKEKNLRVALEAASNISQVPSTVGIREKTKNELQEIALEEKDFSNLKQRFDDLGEELNHQREHNAALMHVRILKIQDTSNQRTMSANNKNEMKGTSNDVERSSKDDRNYSVDRSDHAKEWKNESPLSHNYQNQPHTSQGGHPKFGWLPNNPPSISRKSSSKGEGGSTTSALSKITNRLNFLKERRNQLADELQYIRDDNAGQSSHSSANSMSTEGDNNKRSSNSRSEVQSSYSPRKGMSNECDTIEGYIKHSNKKGDNRKGYSSKPDAPVSHSSVKVKSTEGNSKEYNRKAEMIDGYKKGCSLKADAYPSQNMEQGRKFEYHSSQNLDRLMSEGQSSRSSDKGREQDGQHSSAPRTFSR